MLRPADLLQRHLGLGLLRGMERAIQQEEVGLLAFGAWAAGDEVQDCLQVAPGDAFSAPDNCLDNPLISGQFGPVLIAEPVKRSLFPPGCLRTLENIVLRRPGGQQHSPARLLQ